MITHGDIGDKFYVIIKGVVSVHVPNPAIKDRAVKYRNFQNLMEWRDNEFQKKVEEAKIAL